MAGFARVRTSVIFGLDALPVDVEVQTENTKERFLLVGLGDSAIREARQRVTTALAESGYRVPRSIVVNLSPAELRKEGSALDLPIAVGILAASSQLHLPEPEDISFHGELALNGEVRPVRGAFAMAFAARQRKMTWILLPEANAPEASLATDIAPVGLRHLREIQSFLNGDLPEHAYHWTVSPATFPLAEDPFRGVWGQTSAKRALLIAASGGHNLLMIGPPGCGKSLLASRFPLLLPPLQPEEMHEAVRVHSLAERPLESLLAGRRPLCSPHHTVSPSGLIGGGSVSPIPGEITLAHNGVLFLDELPEYHRSAIEALRVPLESGVVELRRARFAATFPARFQLLAAMNPCPCGRRGVPNTTCRCSAQVIASYNQKISRPLLERIDLHFSLNPVPPDQLYGLSQKQDDSYRDVCTLVLNAQKRQRERQGTLNAYCTSPTFTQKQELHSEAKKLLRHIATTTHLSARSYARLLRVSRTISDLAGEEIIAAASIAEAASYQDAMFRE